MRLVRHLRLIGFCAALLAALVVAAPAAAERFKGTSHPYGVKIRLDTKPNGKPFSLYYGPHHVPCTNGYRLGFHVGGANPPFDRVSTTELVDRYHHVNHDGSDIVIVSKVHKRGNSWHGRFHAHWYWVDHGEIASRCKIAFSYDLEPQ